MAQGYTDEQSVLNLTSENNAEITLFMHSGKMWKYLPERSALARIHGTSLKQHY